MLEDTLEFKAFELHLLRSTYDESLVLVENGRHVSKILHLSLEQRNEGRKKIFSSRDMIDPFIKTYAFLYIYILKPRKSDSIKPRRCILYLAGSSIIFENRCNKIIAPS